MERKVYLRSITELAQFLGVHINTASKYAKTWAAPAVRRLSTNKVVINIEVLDQLMNKRSNANKYN